MQWSVIFTLYSSLLPFGIDWPDFGLRHAIPIHNPRNQCHSWLVKPELTKQAMALKALEILNDKDTAFSRKVFQSHFGA